MKDLIELFGRSMVGLISLWTLFKDNSNKVAMIGALIVVGLWIILPSYESYSKSPNKYKGEKVSN